MTSLAGVQSNLGKASALSGTHKFERPMTTTLLLTKKSNIEAPMTMTCFLPGFKVTLLANESYANRLTSMNEQWKSTIMLDLQISSYIEQVPRMQVNCLGLICL
jgi:hypothetical protein